MSPWCPFQCRPTVVVFSVAFHSNIRLGQKMESHHLVPFAAAPTPFRKYAATRSLAWNGCFMHTDSKKQSLESFAHCTMHPHRKAHFIFGTSIKTENLKFGKSLIVFEPPSSELLFMQRPSTVGFSQNMRKKRSQILMLFSLPFMERTISQEKINI